MPIDLLQTGIHTVNEASGFSRVSPQRIRVRGIIAAVAITITITITSTILTAEPLLVSGTYQKGSNITEPRPQKSHFLQTIHGGVAVLDGDAGFYLLTKVINKPDKTLYIRVQFQNPAGRSPLQNDMAFEPSAERLLFSAPRFVKGLRSYSNYAIIVKIYASREAPEPIDTLRQTIRSYVDTRGQRAQLYNRLKQKP
jgi:hypothetical protein